VNILHARRAAIPALLAALVAGCSSDPMHLGSPIPQGSQLTKGRDIAAQACGFQLLLLIPIKINDRYQRAYQTLAAQAGPDLITQVAVEEEWNWAFVGTVYCTHLRARAVRVVPSPPPPPLPPPSPAAVEPSIPVAPASGTPSAATPPAAASSPAIAPALPAVPVTAPVSLPVIAPAAPAATPPAAAPEAPAPSAAAVPAPAAGTPAAASGLVAGAHVRLRPGAILRARPLPDAEAMGEVDPAATMTLKVVMKKDTGAWWYVNTPSGSGWALDSELEPAP
jgi:hypothetical protein